MMDKKKPKLRESALNRIVGEEGFRKTVYDDKRPNKKITKELLKSGYIFKGTPTVGYGTVVSEDDLKKGHIDGVDIFNGDLDKDTAKDWVAKHPSIDLAARRMQNSPALLSKIQEDVLFSEGYNHPNITRNVLRTIAKGNEGDRDSRSELEKEWTTKYITSKGDKLKGLVDRRKKSYEDFITNPPAESAYFGTKEALDKIKEVLGQKEASAEPEADVSEPETEVPTLLNPDSKKEPLFKDGGVVKKYADGGVSRMANSSELTDLLKRSANKPSRMATSEELGDVYKASRMATPDESSLINTLKKAAKAGAEVAPDPEEALYNTKTIQKFLKRAKPISKRAASLVGPIGAGIGAALLSGDAQAGLGELLGSDPVGQGSDEIPGRAMPISPAEMKEAKEKYAPLLDSPELLKQYRELMTKEKAYQDGGLVENKMDDFFEEMTGMNYTQNPVLDMVEEANQDIPEQPLNQKPEPMSDEEPKAAREQALINEIAGLGGEKKVEKTAESDQKRKPASEDNLDLQSEYKSLLEQLKKPRSTEKSDALKKAEWMDAISSIAGSLDRYGREPRTPGRQTQFAKQVAEQEAKSTGMDALKSRAAILKQLQDLKTAGKPMTAYQTAYLDYLKGSQSKKQEREGRVKKQAEDRMARSLNKEIYGVVKDFEKDDVVQELKKQGISFDQAESLLDAIEADNKVAYGALGTKMARAMGEVGVLTDTDVVRYISRYDVAGRVKDWFSGNFKGKPSDLTQKDLRDIAQIMKIGASNTLTDVRDKYITYATENFGKSAGMTEEDVKKRFGLKDGKLPKESMPNPSNEVRRRTKDGRVAIFDADTKKFLRYEE